MIEAQGIAKKLSFVMERIETLAPEPVAKLKVVEVMVNFNDKNFKTEVSKDWTVKGLREHLAKSHRDDFPSMKMTETLAFKLVSDAGNKSLNESGRRTLGKWGVVENSVIEVSTLTEENKAHLKALKTPSKSKPAQSSESAQVSFLKTLAEGYGK